MLESWEGDMILSIAKPLPAGLHLYQILDGKTRLPCYLRAVFLQPLSISRVNQLGDVYYKTLSLQTQT